MSESSLVPQGPLRPLDEQPPLSHGQFIVRDTPDSESISMDVIFVGAGPAGLAGAIELARLVREGQERGGSLGEIEIGVLEKAGQLGEHNLSGAVVNPSAFQELFPGVSLDEFPFRRPVTKEGMYLLGPNSSVQIPTPPTMRNQGNYIASICEIVRWLGERAEELGVNIFPGFPVDSLIVENSGVIGVRTTPSGLGKGGESLGPIANSAIDVTAQVTVLSEGTRGSLSQAWLDWQGIGSTNPQIFALGVKELWNVKQPLDRIIHTMGWPLPPDAFGGSFMYPMADDLVALGLVAGLDYADARFDSHGVLQSMKMHPLFRRWLEGGKMIEWGAKTIPEGGYHSVPERRHGEGLLIVGDAAGYVDVSSLKGIHYAMHSGILAARKIFEALTLGDTSESGLAGYTAAVDGSRIMRDLHKRRNMPLAYKRGLLIGGVKAGLMTLTKGRFPGGTIEVQEDAAQERHFDRKSVPVITDSTLTFSKADAVFRSGNQTRDDIPSHLIEAKSGVRAEAADFYSHMCPAGVYERDGDRLLVNAPNCIDCKATDVLGPRWSPREGGSGPGYRRM
ncbi:MAG: electron transfer flavoprotein-ubiquinone oxidoreductase [Gemmatimonadetes bacterium]|nr:electron transfer flavoprotein-ubiquinone oxidoreductase [Gemmatimonadota bacterium]